MDDTVVVLRRHFQDGLQGALNRVTLPCKPLPVITVFVNMDFCCRHRESPMDSSVSSCQAKGLSLSRMASGSEENHASSSPGGGRTRPYSAIFAAGMSHR